MYDVTIIGAGPGGYVCAIRAAQLGLQACLLDSSPTLGGTCLNVGCIPSKALLESSHLLHATHNLQQHGIAVTGVKLNLAKMMQRKDNIVRKLTAGISYLTKKNNITVKHGKGKLIDAQTVLLTSTDGEEKIKTKHTVIATGSAPIALPKFPFDGEHIISSTEALSFSSVPTRLAIVGGGVIGLEIASIWQRLGSEVHVIEAQATLIPEMDTQLGKEIQKCLHKQGVKFHLNSTLSTATVQKGQVTLSFAAQKLTVDKMLVAIGRRPYSTGLGIEALGVQTGARGKIKVNAQWCTNIAGVYAIGDVCGGMMLAHKAEEEGIAVAENLAGKAGHVNYQAIPAIVYTHPEVASVGYSEEQAKAQGIKVRIGNFPFSANGRALTAGEGEGFVKIIAAAETDEIIGCHIVGAQASELIAELVLAREYRASAEDVARTMHAHPTLMEAVKEASLNVHQRAIHF